MADFSSGASPGVSKSIKFLLLIRVFDFFFDLFSGEMLAVLGSGFLKQSWYGFIKVEQINKMIDPKKRRLAFIDFSI